jgi:hypothetical protein
MAAKTPKMLTNLNSKLPFGKQRIFHSSPANHTSRACRNRKEAEMLEILVELLILGFIVGVIVVVAFVMKWFIHFAE